MTKPIEMTKEAIECILDAIQIASQDKGLGEDENVKLSFDSHGRSIKIQFNCEEAAEHESKFVGSASAANWINQQLKKKEEMEKEPKFEIFHTRRRDDIRPLVGVKSSDGKVKLYHPNADGWQPIASYNSIPEMVGWGVYIDIFWIGQKEEDEDEDDLCDEEDFICDGIQKLPKPEDIYVQVGPKSFGLIVTEKAEDGGDVRRIPISSHAAEVLIAYGFNYGN